MVDPTVYTLSNNHPVYVYGMGGPAHGEGENGWSTRCGLSLNGGIKPIKLTAAQVHVYLDHAFCPRCFSPSQVVRP